MPSRISHPPSHAAASLDRACSLAADQSTASRALGLCTRRAFVPAATQPAGFTLAWAPLDPESLLSVSSGPR